MKITNNVDNLNREIRLLETNSQVAMDKKESAGFLCNIFNIKPYIYSYYCRHSTLNNAILNRKPCAVHQSEMESRGHAIHRKWNAARYHFQPPWLPFSYDHRSVFSLK